MLIRIELPDTEGRIFKEMCRKNSTTMSKVLRRSVRHYINHQDIEVKDLLSFNNIDELKDWLRDK